MQNNAGGNFSKKNILEENIQSLYRVINRIKEEK